MWLAGCHYCHTLTRMHERMSLTVCGHMSVTPIFHAKTSIWSRCQHFCEGHPLDFGVYLWKYVPIQLKDYLWGHEGLTCSRCSFFLCRSLKFLQTKLAKPCTCGSIFVHSSTETTKGHSQNCYHKVGSMQLSKIILYAVTLLLSFTGSVGPSPNPETQTRPRP